MSLSCSSRRVVQKLPKCQWRPIVQADCRRFGPSSSTVQLPQLVTLRGRFLHASNVVLNQPQAIRLRLTEELKSSMKVFSKPAILPHTSSQCNLPTTGKKHVCFKYAPCACSHIQVHSVCPAHSTLFSLCWPRYTPQIRPRRERRMTRLWYQSLERLLQEGYASFRVIHAQMLKPRDSRWTPRPNSKPHLEKTSPRLK